MIRISTISDYNELFHKKEVYPFSVYGQVQHIVSNRIEATHKTLRRYFNLKIMAELAMAAASFSEKRFSG